MTPNKAFWPHRPKTVRPALFPAADLPVGSNGEDRIPQLGQNHPQQVQFIGSHLTGQGIGQSRHRSRHFTGVHPSHPCPSYADRDVMVPRLLFKKRKAGPVDPAFL